MKGKILAATALMTALGCKTPETSGGSRVKDVAPGGMKYYAANMSSSIQFYATDPQTFDVVEPKVAGQSFDYTQTATGVTIAGFTNALTANPSVNYGYWSQPAWPCTDAYKFVNDTPGASAATDKCMVSLDTEDQVWYSISVDNVGPSGTATPSYTNNPALASLPTHPHPLAAGNLQVGEVATLVDEAAVLTAMNDLDTTYVVSDEARRERNTCLLNGRARGWLDLQAHYYCMMPYSGQRTCYSTSLVTLTAPLAAVTDPQKKLAGVLTAYNQSFNACFAKGAPYELSDMQKAAFQYIMFTIPGAIDFSIESQNQVINDFYAKKASPEARPRRVGDSYPTWQPNQARYDLYRTAEAGMLQKIAAARAAAGAAAGSSATGSGAAGGM